jgi:hypothetical protein
MTWQWLALGLAVWLAVGGALVLLIGRAVRLADRPSSGSDVPLTTAVSRVTATDPVPARAPVRRRTVPLPPIGIALAALAIALMTVGYGFRLTGATGQIATAFSLDAPFSLPRLYVAAVFAAAALAAIAGAGSNPGRRTWWIAVGGVAAGIAVVKAGRNVHDDALDSLEEAAGTRAAILLSAAAAAAVVAALWFLSRHERRDRRRVLSVLSLYAGASVGLSALSSAVSSTTWAPTARYLEESGEALAGVAFLLAVLVGVAPRLVLPGAWALRRAVDVHTLVLPETLSGRTTAKFPNR